MKTRQEVADEYGISVKTLMRKLRYYKVELKVKSRISPKQYEEIVLVLGRPSQAKYKR